MSGREKSAGLSKVITRTIGGITRIKRRAFPIKRDGRVSGRRQGLLRISPTHREKYREMDFGSFASRGSLTDRDAKLLSIAQ